MDLTVSIGFPRGEKRSLADDDTSNGDDDGAKRSRAASSSSESASSSLQLTDSTARAYHNRKRPLRYESSICGLLPVVLIDMVFGYLKLGELVKLFTAFGEAWAFFRDSPRFARPPQSDACNDGERMLLASVRWSARLFSEMNTDDGKAESAPGPAAPAGQRESKESRDSKESRESKESPVRRAILDLITRSHAMTETDLRPRFWTSIAVILPWLHLEARHAYGMTIDALASYTWPRDVFVQRRAFQIEWFFGWPYSNRTATAAALKDDIQVALGATAYNFAGYTAAYKADAGALWMAMLYMSTGASPQAYNKAEDRFWSLVEEFKEDKDYDEWRRHVGDHAWDRSDWPYASSFFLFLRALSEYGAQNSDSPVITLGVFIARAHGLRGWCAMLIAASVHCIRNPARGARVVEQHVLYEMLDMGLEMLDLHPPDYRCERGAFFCGCRMLRRDISRRDSNRRDGTHYPASFHTALAMIQRDTEEVMLHTRHIEAARQTSPQQQ